MAITVYNYDKTAQAQYADFNTYISSRGYNNVNVRIGVDAVLTGNLTIPANVNIAEIANGAKITGAYTLSIGKMSFCGLYQVFDGPTVSFIDGAVEIVRPEWWGGLPDGTTDCTTAIQAAIDSITRGKVLLGMGTYLITSQITIAKSRVSIHGLGKNITFINFVPTAEQICIKISKDGVGVDKTIVNPGVWDVGFISSDTTYKKTAIFFRTVGEGTFSGIAVNSWSGANSVGIHSQGWEMNSFYNCDIRADIPLYIDICPEVASIHCDHTTFRNMYLIADATPAAGGIGSCVIVAPNAVLSNTIFDGTQAWLPKSHGLYWSDTAATGGSINVVLSNIRIEQETDATAYLVYINNGYALYGLTLRNIYGGLTARGFYLRKCINTTIDNVQYVNASNNEAINVSGENSPLTILNSSFQSGTTFNFGTMYKRVSHMRSTQIAYAYYDHVEDSTTVLGNVTLSETASVASYQCTAKDIYFSTSSNYGITVQKSTGNVGVHVSAPGQPLTVKGQVSIEGATTTRPLYINGNDTDALLYTYHASQNLQLAGGLQATALICDYNGDTTNQNSLTIGKRFKGKKGADVASANDVTLGDGNYFDITGATQMNGMSVSGWQSGSEVTLQFDSNPIVKHNTAASAGFASFFLSGAVDFSTGADDTLKLAYDGTYWREISRTVI